MVFFQTSMIALFVCNSRALFAWCVPPKNMILVFKRSTETNLWVLYRIQFVCKQDWCFRYIPIFRESKIGKIFALSKFWRRSHQTNKFWTKLHRLTHTSITNLSSSKKKTKKSLANCYARTDLFFRQMFRFLADAFTTCNIERIFPMQFCSNIPCITWHLDDWKESFVLAKFGSFWAGHRVFRRVAKIWRSQEFRKFCVSRVFHTNCWQIFNLHQRKKPQCR